MISNCPPVAAPQSRIVTGRKGPTAAPLPFDGECDLRSTETRETADDVAQGAASKHKTSWAGRRVANRTG